MTGTVVDRAAAPRSADAPPRVRWAVRLGTGVLRLLARTWRVRELGREAWHQRRREGGATILALWHGQMLPLLAHHRDEGVAVLISEHRDGEIIARVVRAFGFATVRGSTTRGGSRALLEIVAALRRGCEVAMTPDGPRGPRHAFAPGAVIAAHRAGVPIVGVAAHVDRAWRLRSWDAFEVPKPFARITVAYGEPTFVRAESARAAADQASAFETRLRLLGQQAAAAAVGA